MKEIIIVFTLAIIICTYTTIRDHIEKKNGTYNYNNKSLNIKKRKRK